MFLDEERRQGLVNKKKKRRLVKSQKQRIMTNPIPNSSQKRRDTFLSNSCPLANNEPLQNRLTERGSFIKGTNEGAWILKTVLIQLISA